jgi:hypothetical protein
MKKIMMTKYGFVRSPEDDFSDDGNRFTCYRVGRVRVSKLVADGEAYIDGAGDLMDGKLPYQVYKDLPHYTAISELNGIPVASLTDEMLQKLYDDCVAYEKEYIAEENAIAYPSIAELTERCKMIHAKAMLEATHIEQLMSQKAFALACTLSEYEWKRFQDFVKEVAKRSARYDSDLKIEEAVCKMYKHSISFSFMSPTYSDLSDGYYYRELLRLFERV